VYGAALRATEWLLEAPSAQVKSAILLAGACARVPVIVREPFPTRDHTERFLRLQGAGVERDGERITLRPPDCLAPFTMHVPGDPSAAAFHAALGALADDGELVVRDVGLNPGRTGFLNVLRRMGADLAVRTRHDDGPEPVGDLEVRPGTLRATTIQADEIPALIDELPVIACLAARAEGTTIIAGAGELRLKESDRIAALVGNLRAIGVDARERPDGMQIEGTRAPLAGLVTTHGDHRIAMAFAVLGAGARAAIRIDDPACVAISYPQFWDDLATVVAT
jgi:3-phosphoshikimate 1-carboxyvinyltransferase